MSNETKKFLEFAKIHSIKDVINKLPQFMCHIGQEPEIFGTYRRRKNIPLKKAKKKKISEKIKSLSPEKYIHFFVTRKGIRPELISLNGRVACNCKQMAEVAAKLVSELKKTEVYIIGKCLPAYVTGRNPKVIHHHYLTAFIEDNRIRYFDTATYRKVFDMRNHKWIEEDKLGIDRANIDYNKYIFWDKFLQKNSNQKGAKKREIKIKGKSKKIIDDNFSSKKISGGHYYFKIKSPNKKGYFYKKY